MKYIYFILSIMVLTVVWDASTLQRGNAESYAETRAEFSMIEETQEPIEPMASEQIPEPAEPVTSEQIPEPIEQISVETEVIITPQDPTPEYPKITINGLPIENLETKPTSQYQPRTFRVKVTAYCPCRKCCGRWSRGKKTAYGRSAHDAGVAVDRSIIPLGSYVDIPDYPYGPNNNGSWIIVDATGSKVVGLHIDVRFPTHGEALQWASTHQYLTVRVWIKIR